MSLFGDSRPRITNQEFAHHIRPELRNKGFSDEKLDRLEGMFASDLNRTEGGSRQRGIYADELKHTMDYIHGHHDATHFDEHELKLVQESASKYLEHH